MSVEEQDALNYVLKLAYDNGYVPEFIPEINFINHYRCDPELTVEIYNEDNESVVSLHYENNNRLVIYLDEAYEFSQVIKRKDLCKPFINKGF